MNEPAAQQETSTSAKLLFRPISLAGSVLGGLLANVIFKKLWRQAGTGERTDPPGALATGSSFKTILLAAALQGTIFSVVKTLVDRGGARVFTRWSGEWPSD